MPHFYDALEKNLHLNLVTIMKLLSYIVISLFI